MTHEILQLPPCLLHNAILSAYDDGHPTQVPDFSPAHHQRVDIEATPSKDTRYAGQHTRFVLYKAVKDVSMLGHIISNMERE